MGKHDEKRKHFNSSSFSNVSQGALHLNLSSTPRIIDKSERVEVANDFSNILALFHGNKMWPNCKSHA